MKIPTGFMSLFLICLPLAWGHISFPKHMEVGKLYRNMTLTCRTDFKGTIIWKYRRQGDPLWNLFEDESGTAVTWTELETPDTGEYSCWDGEKMLDHMHLLLETDEQEAMKDAKNLHCSAQSYSCSFTCSWNLTDFVTARVNHYRDGESSSSWVYPSSTGQGPFWFTLNISSSPFAEESSPIVITAEAVSSQYYLTVTRQFYLRDIVIPEPPQLVKCEKKGKTLVVEVEPATSWSKPLSYFPLEHQIKFFYQSNGKMNTTERNVIPEGVSKFCVRSRDPLVPSAWSQWSPWKNVTYRKPKKGVGPGENDIVCKKNKMGKKKSERSREASQRQ